MITKDIIYFGRPTTIACDAKCEKAWGLQMRPRAKDDGDDIIWMSDDELDEAPENPGTYEGDHAKPLGYDERLNKWCCRECERCVMVNRNEPITLPDWSKRVHNLTHTD